MAQQPLTQGRAGVRLPQAPPQLGDALGQGGPRQGRVLGEAARPEVEVRDAECVEDDPVPLTGPLAQLLQHLHDRGRTVRGVEPQALPRHLRQRRREALGERGRPVVAPADQAALTNRVRRAPCEALEEEDAEAVDVRSVIRT